MTDSRPIGLSSTPSRRRIALAVVALVLLSARVGIAIAKDRYGSSSTAKDPTAIGAVDVNLACISWTMSAPATNVRAGPANWCGDMITWMNAQVTTGGMNSAMMWGDPDRMLTSCRSWLTTTTTTVTAGEPSTCCDQMVDWMRKQANGDWDGSMMNGSMMGR